MTHCRFFRALVLWTIVVCVSSVAAQDPVIDTDNRATSSTFRDRGTSYAPTYLIYVDKQRTGDDAKQLIAELTRFRRTVITGALQVESSRCCGGGER
jgi:hypothetical protein